MASYGNPYTSDTGQHPQPFSPPSGGQIPAGTVTYTTSTGPDGRVIYNPFKAVPASYQTPNGVVTGIQWIPAEATQILPTGAQPANAEFAASWNRGYLSRDEERALKEWQRTEEKRRKKEEKESAKRVEKWERERRIGERDRDDDRDLRRAREQDQVTRERRRSFNAGASPIMGAGYPSAGTLPGGYPTSPSMAGGHGGGAYSAYGGASDLDRRMADLDLDRQGYGRERKISSNLGGDRPRKYSIGESDRSRRISGNFGDRTGTYRSTSPYPTAGAGYPPARSTSPYPTAPGGGGGGGYPPVRSTSPYPNAPGGGGGGGVYPPVRSTSPYPNAPGGGGVYPPARSTSPYPNAPGGGGVYPPARSTSPYPNAPGGIGAYPPTNRPTSPYPTAATGPYPPVNRSTSPYPTAAGGGAYPPTNRPTSPYPTTGAGYPTTNAYPTSGNTYSGANTYGATGGAQYGGTNYPSSPNTRSDSAYPGAASGYTGSNYPTSPGRVTEPFPRAPSPYSGAGGVYPRGHVLEGQPIGGPVGQQSMGQSLARSRATTPIPGTVPFPSNTPFPQSGMRGASPIPSPRMPNASLGGGYGGLGEAQLSTPEGFSRPRNAALSYTPFEPMKIQNMDEFEQHIPKMPLVLQPHDVYHEDWIRLMTDLALAWAGRLPVPELNRGGRPPKRSTLAADLIDLWNSSFFLTRGVEVVLYKGRERRSGPNAGLIDPHIPTYDEDDDSDLDSLSSSSSSDSALSDEERHRHGEYGLYGRQSAGQANHSLDARRRRQERKADKKRRRKEKKQKKKAKERERRYALFISCVQPRDTYQPPSMGPSGPGGIMGYGGLPGGLGMTV